MYTPKDFEETRIDILHQLMKSHPLASLVTLGDAELIVNHLPFLIDPSCGLFGTLRGHVARANPVWQAFSHTVESVVIFQGPESYITPSWYPSKEAHGKVVPTWNYAVVHAYGYPRVIENAAWLRAHVTELTNKHEPTQALPWKVSDAPQDFTDKLINAIVGIEISISTIRGKWKVSQNRPMADRLGVVAGLESLGGEQARAMASLVTQLIDP